MSATRLCLYVVLLSMFSAVRTSAETIYFKNRRTIDALSYEIKGSLVFITMTNGTTVYVRGDSIDWDGTERLKSADVVLRQDEYEPEAGDSDDEEEDDGYGGGAGVVLSAADLRRGGSGLKKRKRTPHLVVEVSANQGCWVDTRINLNEGKLVVLHATGSVDLGDGGSSGPVGLASPAGGDHAPDLPLGALIARVGLAGQPIMVGKGLKLKPRSSGRLFLCVNDMTPGDDTGMYTVRVSQPRGNAASGNMVSVPSRLSDGSSGGSSGSTSASSPPSGRPARAVTKFGAVDRARSARDAAGQR